MRLIALVCLTLLILARPLYANGTGGSANPLISIKALGQGTAFVAQADDPSANYINPAGLAWLEGTFVSLAVGDSLGLTTHQGVTVAGHNQTQPSERVETISGSFFATQSFSIGSKRATLGVGLSSPFLFESAWNDISHVRHFTLDYQLESLLVNPNLSVQLNQKLSVAAGADFMLVDESDHHQIFEYFFNGNTGDVTKDIAYNRDAKGHAYGWNVGVLWKPAVQHSFAAAYRSELRTKLSGDLKLSNMSAATQSTYNFGSSDYSTPVESESTFPQILTLGYCWNPTPRSTVLIDYEWTGWNSFKRNDLTIEDTDPTRRSLIDAAATPAVRWRDTHSLSVGSEFLYWNNVRVRFGFSRVTSAVPTNLWEPSIPDAARNLFSLGSGITWKKFTFDIAGALIVFDKQNIDNDLGSSFNQSLDGSYMTKEMVLGASVTYRFLN